MLGLSAGTVSLVGSKVLEPSYGMPESRIGRIRGTLYRDPAFTASGGALIKVHIQEIVGNDGTIASGKGVISLYLSRISPALKNAPAGSLVSIAVEKGSDGRLYPKPDTLRLPAPVKPLIRLRLQLLGSAGKAFSAAPDASLLLEALLLGEKREPSDPIFVLFRQAGASHILALSGMHVGILSALFLFGAVPFIGRRWARFILIIMLPCYLLTVGLRPSLLRAVIFFSIVSFTPPGKDAPLRALTLTFLLQILFFPLSVTELSFQLSYLALFGIITLAPPAAYILRRVLIPPPLALLCAASLSALASTAPLGLLIFGELRFASLVSSLLMLLPVLLLMYCGIALLLLYAALPLRALFLLCAQMADRTARVVSRIAELCSKVPYYQSRAPERDLVLALALLTCMLLLRYLLSDGTPPGLRFTRCHISLDEKRGIGNAEEIWPEFSHCTGGEGETAKAA
jgi:ComEC/Rec2-related protein